MKKYNSNVNSHIKVGDIVTSYYKGIWEVIEIGPKRKNTNNTESAPLVTLKKLYTHHHKPVTTSIIKVCDIAWCSVLSDAQIQSLKEFANKFYS